MKDFFTALLMTLSMFCALPCPCPRWDDGLRGRMLLCLPLVGLLLGGLWALAAWLMALLGCPALLQAALLTAIPFLLTGFLHLDGYMDCADAILSRRDLETRRRILKDSHVGSFAVIALSLLLLFTFALWSEASLSDKLPCLLLIPAISRACAAACVLRLQAMPGSSYCSMPTDRGGSVAMSVLAAALSILSVLLCGIPGVAGPAVLFGSMLTIYYGARQLGGMSGDISGMAITIGEFCGIAVLCLL